MKLRILKEEWNMVQARGATCVKVQRRKMISKKLVSHALLGHGVAERRGGRKGTTEQRDGTKIESGARE